MTISDLQMSFQHFTARRYGNSASRVKADRAIIEKGGYTSVCPTL